MTLNLHTTWQIKQLTPDMLADLWTIFIQFVLMTFLKYVYLYFVDKEISFPLKWLWVCFYFITKTIIWIHWYTIDKNCHFWNKLQLEFFLKKMTMFVNFFENNDNFCQFFDIQIAIFQRVRSGSSRPEFESQSSHNV